MSEADFHYAGGGKNSRLSSFSDPGDAVTKYQRPAHPAATVGQVQGLVQLLIKSTPNTGWRAHTGVHQYNALVLLVAFHSLPSRTREDQDLPQ